MRLLTCLTFGLLLGSAVTAAERPLRFAVVDSSIMPVVEIKNGQVVDGILYHLQRRLAEKVGRDAQMLVMPRMRVQKALQHGEVDVRCFVSPGWVDEAYPRYAWSVPFMIQRTVLISRSAQPVNLDTLHDKTIGAVLGFAYPELQALFASGQWRRDNVRTQGQVLSKLAAGRDDYAISNDLALQWFNSQRDEGTKLHEVHEIASEPVACLIHDEPDVPTTAILNAMVQMKEDGEFDAIVQRYR